MKIMKTVLCVAVVVGLCAGTVSAANGRVSERSLAKMGLTGMKSLSDEQGSQIRGAGHDKFPNPIQFINLIKNLVEHQHQHHHHH